MSLQLIQADCAGLHARLQAIRARFPTGQLPDLARRITDATALVGLLTREAQQPVRVGLVGAFNAGKTRLLEALLGCAGRLNVIDKPATGNLVEFELRVEAKSADAQLDRWAIQFMHETQDAARILRRLLAEARDLQNREVAANPAAEVLNGLLYEAEFKEGDRPRWGKVQDWAAQAHAKARAKQFQAVAFEVYRLAYTVGQAGDWLGREFPIAEADAVTLMSLDYDPQEVFSQDLSQWRITPPQAAGSLAGLSPSELKTLFPIVRKITVRATLPPAVAEAFGGAGGLELRLVDCPGAGADGSNFRDTVLCAQELKDVDSVFALLNAKNPGENRQFIDELLRIWGPQAKDRILAVVSRFDELPHDKNVSAGVRDQLAGQAGPLTAAELLKAIPTLDTIYKSATDTVMDRDTRRVAVVSTMGYLSAELYQERARRGTTAFYEKELKFPTEPLSAQLAKPWMTELAAWARVADRLARSPDKESKALGELLREYADGGGFTRLHGILQRHLSQHGQANKLARLAPEHAKAKALVAELEAEVEVAVAKLPPETAPTVEPGLPFEEALHAVAREYQSLVGQAEDAGRRYPLIRRPAGKSAAEPTIPAVRRWLVTEVFRWEEWRLLFGRIGKSEVGLVDLVDRDDPTLAGRESDRHDLARTPVKSDDFLAPFVATLTKVRANLRDRCKDALKHHGEELRRELEGRLGGPARAERVRAALTQQPGQTADALLSPHEKIADSWLDPHLPAANPATAEHDRQTFAEYFPLQHGVSRPLYYAWHKPLALKNTFDPRRRHLMYVVKLRQTVVDAALGWLDDMTHAAEEAMRVALLERLKQVRNDLRAAAAARPAIDEDTGPTD